MRLFRGIDDAEYHESLAREHVRDGMPIVEVARNNDVPVSAVRRYVELYRRGGADALRAAAQQVASTLHKPLSPARLAALRAALTEPPTTPGREARVAALIEVSVRRLPQFRGEVIAILEQGADVIECLQTLGAVGDVEALDRLRLDPRFHSYRGWVDSVRERAVIVKRALSTDPSRASST